MELRPVCVETADGSRLAREGAKGNASDEHGSRSGDWGLRSVQPLDPTLCADTIGLWEPMPRAPGRE